MANAGKNKRRQLEAYDAVHNEMLSVDSAEEKDFLNWCCEAHQLSVIEEFYYQPMTFTLADAESYIDIDGKKRCLFREHSYSPDFVIEIDPEKNRSLSKELKISQEQIQSEHPCSVWIDIKGTFVKNARSFSIDRKWTWKKFKIYIHELVPQKFFKLFGCPKASRLTEKTKKPRKMFSGFMSLLEAFSH